MARFAYGRHTAKVAIGTYPDDDSYPIGTNEWNEDINNLGMLGFTSVEGTCATNVVTLTGNAVANTGLSSVIRVDGQGDAADDLDGIAITDTNEYDLLYLFAENSGRAITVQHASSNVSTGKIYLLAGTGTKVLSTTTPMLVIRKGNDWYEYGGGAQTTPTDITVADESSDTTCFPLFVTAATGDLEPKSGSNLAFNSSSGILTATGFAGALTGAVTGNADTATTATNVTVADESSDTSCNVLFTTAATGDLPPKSGTNLTFNSSSGLLTATLFAGDLTGSVTGNADTATSATTATTATNVTVADESSDTSCNVLFTTAATGNLPPKSGTNLTFNSDTGVLSAVGLTLSGDLTVNGTTTTINSTTLTVDDKNIEMGSVSTPSDTTADGGGITLKGATDKTIIWDNANDNWTSNQDWNIATGKVFKVNNVSTLTATALGAAVAGSSLTSVGALNGGSITSGFGNIDYGSSTISTGNLTATQVDITAEGDLRLQDASGGQYVGFEAPATVSSSYTLEMPAATGSSGEVLKMSSSANVLEWGSAGGGATATHDFTIQAYNYSGGAPSGTTRYIYTKVHKNADGTEDTNNEDVFIRCKKNGTADTEVQIA